MALAQESEEGLHWGGGGEFPEPGVQPAPPRSGLRPPEHRNRSAAIEITGYATLALLEHGDRLRIPNKMN
jgi:hypothetical protein